MDTLKWVDELILCGATKFAHWFQEVFGRTNFFLCRAFILFFVVSLIVSTINLPSNVSYFMKVWGFLFLGCLFYLYAPISTDCKVADEYFLEHGQLKLSPSLISRRLSAPVGIFINAAFWIPLVAIHDYTTDHGRLELFMDVVGRSWGLHIMLYLYFLRVTPKPPARIFNREPVSVPS